MSENASNRLRAERAEARVAELERFHDVVQTAMQDARAAAAQFRERCRAALKLRENTHD